MSDVYRTHWLSRLDPKDGVPIRNAGQLFERGVGWDPKELTSFEFRRLRVSTFAEVGVQDRGTLLYRSLNQVDGMRSPPPQGGPIAIGTHVPHPLRLPGEGYEVSAPAQLGDNQ
jgi:hypothetical protein